MYTNKEVDDQDNKMMERRSTSRDFENAGDGSGLRRSTANLYGGQFEPPFAAHQKEEEPVPTYEELLERLDHLLDELGSIIRVYVPSLGPSASRIRWLHWLYDRVMVLFEQIQSSNGDTRDGGQLVGFDEAARCVEMEWKKSEVAALWYGPSRALREKIRPRLVDGGVAQARVKPDQKYVGLYDEGKRE
jgi:hypothetical protein